MRVPIAQTWPLNVWPLSEFEKIIARIMDEERIADHPLTKQLSDADLRGIVLQNINYQAAPAGNG